MKVETRRNFFLAFIFALIISTGAQAQESTIQRVETRPNPPQEIKKPQQETAKQPTQEQEPVQAEDAESDYVTPVIPPAPKVIKRNANTISIPLKAEDSEAKSDRSVEERPVTSSVVKVNSVYGYRRDPFTRRAKFHSGVDLKARRGDPVGASHPGVVEFAGWHRGYGNLVIVNHGGGITTYYAHLSAFEVSEGDRVDRGTIIGRAGSTGRATSPHLHYELRVDGNPVNPMQTLALDPTSDYFNESRPMVDAGRDQQAPGKKPEGEN